MLLEIIQYKLGILIQENILSTLHGHTNEVNCIGLIPDSSKIVSGFLDASINIWYVRTGICLNTLQGFMGYVISVAISPDGSKIVSRSQDESIKAWIFTTGKCITHLHSILML